jgi:acetyl-CoA carboxylase biotin carboxyl carrier protein
MSDYASKVDELGEILRKHGLTSIKYKNGDISIEVRKDSGRPVTATAAVAGPSVTAVPEAVSGEAVPSPMVGTFYRKPLPTEPPYVEEGQRVGVGEVIGMIEAMKVFNEVESPIGGVVRKFLVESGTLVQEGEPLCIIEP